MADPYNAAVAAANAQLVPPPAVGPAALPPQFVGRFPGAPLPQPAAPPAPPAFVPRFDPNALAVKGAFAGANQPAPGVVQPANAASTPAPAPAQPTSPINPLQISPLGPGITPERGRAFVAGLDKTYTPPAQAPGQPVNPNPGAGNPLPPGMQDASIGLPQGDVSDVGGGGYAGVGSGRLIDPAGAIQRGYDQQQSYQASALQALMDLARQGGSPMNASFRFAHLAPAFAAAVGNNNFGGVQAQGVDALNNANGGIEQSENYANASRFNALANFAGRELEVGEQHDQAVHTPREIAQDANFNQYGMQTGAHTTYGTRAGGFVPITAPSNTQKPSLDVYKTQMRAKNPSLQNADDAYIESLYKHQYGNQ